jgi:hypothetical protein
MRSGFTFVCTLNFLKRSIKFVLVDFPFSAFGGEQWAIDCRKEKARQLRRA